MIFLQREFMAAVCMSLLTALFAVNVSDLSEEAGLLLLQFTWIRV